MPNITLQMHPMDLNGLQLSWKRIKKCFLRAYVLPSSKFPASSTRIADLLILEIPNEYAGTLKKRSSLSYCFNSVHAACLSLDKCHTSAAQLRQNHLTDCTCHTSITSKTSADTAFNNMMKQRLLLPHFGSSRNTLQRSTLFAATC